LYFIRALPTHFEKIRPGGNRKRIGARNRKVGPRPVQFRERRADSGTLPGIRTTAPNPFQKRHEGRGPSGEPTKHRTFPHLDRLRTGQAA
jgi:hypothetical protein